MNIGLPELIVIFIVALLVIGPKRLPDVAQALGKGLAEFKRAMDDVKSELNVDEVKRNINENVEEMKDSLLLRKSYDEEGKKETASSGGESHEENSSQSTQPRDPKTPVEGS
jgi:Tat protein translocase TatB subunit